MAVFAGIDEAGYGPILGPLVVSSSMFSIPDDLVGADLWNVLRRSVVDKRKQRAGRLLICDSKKAYSKALGISHLQRTVLAFLRCIDEQPSALGELLMMVCPDLTERLAVYPWYSDAGNYRITADEKDITLASHVLRNDLVSGGIEFLSFRSCCLDVAYYNRMVAAVKNKAEVLFSATAQLIKHACDDCGADELQVVVDRQGGRVRYRRNLQRMFPDMELRILCENANTSSYELKAAQRKMRLHFVVGADARFLPVSLASMVSKYLRELLVASINSYFIRLNDGLRPTAGYWKDGVRFIEDLRKKLPHIEFDASQLIRCR
jgi:ribonuclease HII